MNQRTLRIALFLSALFATPAARAMDVGLGLEGAATATGVRGLSPGDSAAGNLGVGLQLEERYPLTLVELELWEDIQTPIALQTGGSYAAGYYPAELGLRLGLGIGPLRPYVGILVNDLILSDRPSDGPTPNPMIFGAGGELGADIVILFLRVGLDFRGFETLTNPVQGSAPPYGGFAVQALLNARLSF
ncbi:MAG: hypothetical protein ACYCWW_16945 [Deltaproteobacteria bacterium]